MDRSELRCRRCVLVSWRITGLHQVNPRCQEGQASERNLADLNRHPVPTIETELEVLSASIARFLRVVANATLHSD